MAKFYTEPLTYADIKSTYNRKFPISEYGTQQKDTLLFETTNATSGMIIKSKLYDAITKNEFSYLQKYIYSMPYIFKKYANPNPESTEKTWYRFNRVFVFLNQMYNNYNPIYKNIKFYCFTEDAIDDGWTVTTEEEVTIDPTKEYLYHNDVPVRLSSDSVENNRTYFNSTFLNTNVLKESTEDEMTLISYEYGPLNYFYTTLKTVDKLVAYLKSNIQNAISNIYPYDEPEKFALSGAYQIPDIVPINNEQKVYAISDVKVITPIIFGEIDTTGQRNAEYTGDAATGVTFIMHCMGTIKNPIIWDSETREYFKLDTSKFGTTIGTDEGSLIAGDDVIVDTVKGEKSVVLIRDGQSYNVISYMDKNSTWFVLNKGNNYFFAEAEEGVQFIQLTIKYNDLYEGV